MNNGNIAVVSQVFERFAEGDVPGLMNLQSDAVEWDHRGPDSPLNNLYKGKAGVAEFLGTLSTTQEVLEFEPQKFFANDNQVVALGHFRFKVIETGKEWASDFAMIFIVKNNLVTYWRPIFDYTAEAMSYQS